MPGTRSFWAWGYEEQLPDETGRAALAQAVAALLGREALSLRPLPRFSDVVLPAPRLAVPSSLAAFATTDARERALHTYGKSFLDQLRAFSLDFAKAPDFVLLPRDEADVITALAACSAQQIALIPFGGGTSVVGGVEGDVGVGYRGVASLDLRQLNRLLEVDAVSRAARIQAGATGPELEAQLSAHDLTLRHYPQSFEFSTLGGWLATRAGGHFATLYTHIDDLVEAVRFVTASSRGPVLTTRRLPASGAGPQPERLLLGSEGAFGVFTEAWLRVQKRPRFRSSASVHFADLEQAVPAVRAVAQAALYPTNCRLLDASEAMLHGVSGSGGPVLLLGFESAEHSVEGPLKQALDIVLGLGGSCPRGPLHRESGQRGGDSSTESWRQAFFAAPYRQSALLSLGVMADTFETACTWERFPTLHQNIRRAVLAALSETCGGGIVTLRFTHVYPDGPAPYFTFLGALPAGADAKASAAIWRTVKQAASDAILESGGTITHHHAVGRTHLAHYERERAPLFGDALCAVKRSFDPAGVLNPGVLIENQQNLKD